MECLVVDLNNDQNNFIFRSYLLAGKALEAVTTELRRQVARAIVCDPPRHLQWMRGCPPDMQQALVTFMTDQEDSSILEENSMVVWF